MTERDFLYYNEFFDFNFVTPSFDSNKLVKTALSSTDYKFLN